jgi:glycosyltransferase involved in cell wall biosynthesis
MLKRAIQSVIGQSFADWELIIIDDGSTDDTSLVVKEFVDERIKYYYQENAERSIARNKGIDLASGKYICFLDSDDYYLPNHLEELLLTIKEKQEPLAFFFCNLYKETNEILSLPEECEFVSKNNIEYVVQNIISTPQACIHVQILKEHQFNTKLFVGEDLNLWMHILLKYPLIKSIKRTLILCIHEGRTVNVHARNIYKYHLDAFRLAIKDNAIKNSISRKIRRSIYSECYLGMGKFHLFRKKKLFTILMILVSLYYQPGFQLKFKINIIYCVLFNFEMALKIAK